MSKKLSVVIPIYNESAYIERCLDRISQVKIPNWEIEIIAVDDGSTDDTLSLLQKFIRENIAIKVKIISLQNNKGKGHALRIGIQEAKGDILIVQDSDLEYDPNDYTSIVSEYKNKDVNVVYGSRILGSKIYHSYNAGLLFLLGGITLTKIINLAFGTNLTDQPTGYKSWRNSLSKNLLKYCQTNGFEFEVEMTAFFSKTNKIVEVPIHYYPRTVLDGKKIRFTDFMKSIFAIFKSLGRPINP